jgi:tetratricopeptide (TPR) repeat protein
MGGKSRVGRALAAGAVLVLASAAGAQTALGDGRGLERDHRVGGTGNTPRKDFMAEVRARNALVTGNVGGGASLRINPGYTAPDEFRGQLGSDDLFRFRRDSIQSAVGYRGTQGLQYQSAYTIGGVGPVVTRLDSYGAAGDLPRAGYVQRRDTSGVGVRDNVYAPQRMDTRGELLERELSPVGTLRSTGAFQSTMGLAPALVAEQQTERGRERVVASSLLGLRVDVEELRDDQLTARELAEKPRMERQGAVTGPDFGERGPSLSANQRGMRTAYDDLRVRLEMLAPRERPERTEQRREAQPAEEPKQNVPVWEERIRELREQIERQQQEDAANGRGLRPPGTIRDPMEAREELRKARERRLAREEERKKRLAGMDTETIEMIKKAGGEATSYTQGTPGSLFDVHVRAGEEALARGQYFDAEERFARALAMRPGDVTVMAARMNAQIGAGLYLSAAVNLRQLLEMHPEVIGVRYTGRTMPSKERLKNLVVELRASLAKAAASQAPVPEESALLLAYIGFQTRDLSAVRDGLEALTRTERGATDPLLPVLRRVWLEENVGK